MLHRTGSLSAAARELDITAPAATMRLATMEKRLGVRLLNRSTRKISLTPEGETYLHHALRLLQALREMDEAVTGNRSAPRGLLRINAPLGFGRTVIAPLMTRFVQQHPLVEVQLEVTDRPMDLIETGFDLAVRFGELPDNRLTARRIMSNRRFLCASPDYLRRNGTPRRLEDLARHRCIVHRQNDDAYGVWRLVVNGRTEMVKVHGALSSNDGDIVQGWALDGLGIVMRSEWDVNRHLASGRLVRVLPHCTLPDADLYAYFPSREHLPARTRQAINFLASKLPHQRHIMNPRIYHNPKCGTSRNTLAIIKASGETPEVIEYLKTPPSRDELVSLLSQMGITARDLLRRKGTPYDELGLDNPGLSEDQLIDAMMAHPILINRPIVVTDKGARLCRPSEQVFELLDNPVARFVKEDGEELVWPRPATS